MYKDKLKSNIVIKKIRTYKYLYSKFKNSNCNSFFSYIKKNSVVFGDLKSGERKVVQASAFKKQLMATKFLIEESSYFVGLPQKWYYQLDNDLIDYSMPVGNLTPDYLLVMENGFFKRLTHNPKPNKELLILHKGLKTLFSSTKRSVEKNKNKYIDHQIYESHLNLFKHVVYEGAHSFVEALQLLFLAHNLCWLEGASLVGLGLMDQYLFAFYEKDIINGVITDENVKELLKDFVLNLSNNIDSYSAILKGDTGQAIIIGSKPNKLTEFFLEIFGDIHIASPKLIFRINEESTKILPHATEVLLKQTGSPLFINDKVVYEGLKRYDYDDFDIANYGVSACWEPLIPGLSFDMNNIMVLNFLKPLENILYNDDISNILDFEKFMLILKSNFSSYINDLTKLANDIEWKPSVYLSTLFSNCIESGKGIHEGGGKYNYYGFTSLGFSNLINALAFIKLYVFEKKIIDKTSIRTILIEDFVGYDNELLAIQRSEKFGQDKELTNSIAITVSDWCYNYLFELSNRYGCKFKLGLGGVDFITGKNDVRTNFDGRIKGDFFSNNYSPQFGTHTDPISYINSLTTPDLSKMINGSCMEMTFNMSKNMNSEKIAHLLHYFVNKGGQSIQFNFIKLEMLLEAQKNPDKYKDFIVRVWGMSSYFVDLPFDYQMQIIARVKEGL